MIFSNIVQVRVMIYRLLEYTISPCPTHNSITCLFVHVHVYRPPHLKDLEALEPAFYNSLLWIQENDPEPLDLTFTVEEVCLCNYVLFGFIVHMYTLSEFRISILLIILM